ncbi:MAG: endonuclease [Candidatus Diapherotrites archaeon]|nr:endonuclease [Candidatus Diapherotrites archaeon]
MYKLLLEEFSYQNWWPVFEEKSERPVYRYRKKLTELQMQEICIGAILTQNTAWQNVVKALQNLRRANKLSFKKIARSNVQEIARLIKPSGYYNQKAARLKKFAEFVLKNFGSLQKMFSLPLEQLRALLISLHGIGKETADNILLYAAFKKSFVVDAYTLRIFERIGYGKLSYEQAKGLVEQELKDLRELQEFHALLVRFAQNYCLRRNPRCGECFLKKYCKFANTLA